jgi:hypothetical protein
MEEKERLNLQCQIDYGSWERKLGEDSSSYLFVIFNIFSLLVEDAHDFPL